MALFVVLLLQLLSVSSKTSPKFSIDGCSWVSTDSKRDLSNAHLLMPMFELALHSQTLNSKLNTDSNCGQISVLHLPDIPFQLQFIQPTIKDTTDILDFEQEMNDKWHEFKQMDIKIIDPFFNNNLAFYVPDIDIYLQRLQDIHQSQQSIQSPFYSLVIEWQITNELSINSLTFYSLIVHSPDSSIMYEFISNHKPLLISSWMKSDIPRATFNGLQTYPWQMNHELIPIRIGMNTIDIEGSIAWHRNIFNSESVHGIHSDDIYIGTNVAFVSLENENEIQIEIAFFQTSTFITDFTVDKYLSLVNSKYDQFCDEWFFNYFSVFGNDLELDVYVQISKDNGYHVCLRMCLIIVVYCQILYFCYLYFFLLQKYQIFSDEHLYHLLISDPMTGYAIEMVGHLSLSLVDDQFLSEWNSKLCQSDCSSVQKNVMKGNVSRYSVIEENNEVVCFLIICIVFGICAFCFMNENRDPKNISDDSVKNTEMIPLINI